MEKLLASVRDVTGLPPITAIMGGSNGTARVMSAIGDSEELVEMTKSCDGGDGLTLIISAADSGACIFNIERGVGWEG